ncbi:unnamed protein product [Prorocentrum cordatum]|uniref:Uncharacterized protein n=1 Tax=Prorocentrum cordatum TaxID=2364126 RepID=A0ABN9TZW1_9DINO|nr:unnamed protein product [Polarella glacialis]
MPCVSRPQWDAQRHTDTEEEEEEEEGDSMPDRGRAPAAPRAEHPQAPFLSLGGRRAEKSGPAARADEEAEDAEGGGGERRGGGGEGGR